MYLLLLFPFCIALYAQFNCPTANTEQWTTVQKGKYWHFSNGEPGIKILRGVVLSGFQTGSINDSYHGAGCWEFVTDNPTVNSSFNIMDNVIQTLVDSWNTDVIRIPICGSAWLQNYLITANGSFHTPISYRDWIDHAICKALSLGNVVILDNHLWAIGKETFTQKDQGPEDGCNGIDIVEGQMNCADHDWYGFYQSNRTGLYYNIGDDQLNWQCPRWITDGCSLDNLMRDNNTEHFLNLWYELGNYYKSYSSVWFELVSELYQRQSSEFGSEYGDPYNEDEFNWSGWSSLMNQTVSLLRDTVKSENIIIIGGLDWNSDWLGDDSNQNFYGPIMNPSLLVWSNYSNIAYSFHPYQQRSCCGEIGTDPNNDLSQTDPYQSAYCNYPPIGPDLSPIPSNSRLPVPGSICNFVGYGDAVNKKSPPCYWSPTAYPPGNNSSPGMCVGDPYSCLWTDESECDSIDWSTPKAGGWSKWVLPMQNYGPLIATEFGSFDCSSPYVTQFLKWARQFGVSYTAWAIWPGDEVISEEACTYPSISYPSITPGLGFGQGPVNCTSLAGCQQFIVPLPYAGVTIAADIRN